jgi:acetyl-CoA acetyltransferase
MNAPASRLAIAEAIKGPSTTVSTGSNSFLDAIGHGCLALRQGWADAMLCNSVEALSETALSFLDDCKKKGSPAAKRIERYLPNEGSLALVLGAEGTASTQQYVWISGYSASFIPARISGETVSRAVASALTTSLGQSRPKLVVLALSARRALEDAVVRGINSAVNTDDLVVANVGRLVGECGANASGFALLLAYGLLSGRVPWESIRSTCIADTWKLAELGGQKQSAAILSFDWLGNVSSLILEGAA